MVLYWESSPFSKTDEDHIILETVTSILESTISNHCCYVNTCAHRAPAQGRAGGQTDTHWENLSLTSLELGREVLPFSGNLTTSGLCNTHLTLTLFTEVLTNPETQSDGPYTTH